MRRRPSRIFESRARLVVVIALLLGFFSAEFVTPPRTSALPSAPRPTVLVDAEPELETEKLSSALQLQPQAPSRPGSKRVTQSSVTEPNSRQTNRFHRDLPPYYDEDYKLRHPTSITLMEPPPRWILSSQAWKALGNGPVTFDVDIASGKPYFGVRVVLPFGS